MSAPITVPFTYAHDQAPVRLVELPPAVLSLLSASSPPVLKIKAAPPPANLASSTPAHHAVLCTDSQTFSLRQVHSSNSILLLSPTSSGAVSVTSTVSSYLELLPVTPDAKSLITGQLPLYSGRETRPQNPGQSKRKLLKDIPASDAECQSAWRECLAFEHAGVCYRPSPDVALQTLKEAFTSAMAEGIKLTSPFTCKRVIEAIDDSETPALLVHAVLQRVSTQYAGEREVGEALWVLNNDECVKAAGRMVLEDWSERNKNDMMYISFLSKWKAAVPDECIDLCKLDCLKVCALGLPRSPPVFADWNFCNRTAILCLHLTRSVLSLAGSWMPARKARVRPEISGTKGSEKAKSRDVLVPLDEQSIPPSLTIYQSRAPVNVAVKWKWKLPIGTCRISKLRILFFKQITYVVT
jgi:sister chromatid cohesion protein DCC1